MYGNILNQFHLQSLREKTKFQESRVEELQQRLYEGKKALTSREVQIQELEHKVKLNSEHKVNVQVQVLSFLIRPIQLN